MKTVRSGAYTALITPFDQRGQIDVEKLDANIIFQLRNGISGIVPAGTTGESPTLDHREHKLLMSCACDEMYRKDRPISVIAGIGSNSTNEAVAFLEHAVEQGADGVLAVDCYYNRPPSEFLRLYYHGPLAARLGTYGDKIDYIPYIIPGRTGTKLFVEDLRRLADEFGAVSGVKDATGDPQHMKRVREAMGSEFSILSGDDGLTAQMMSKPEIAGNGVISVVSNIVPGAVAEMVENLSAGNIVEGMRLHQKLRHLFNCVGITAPESENGTFQKYPNPCPIKTMMAILGIDTGVVRQPLGPMHPHAVGNAREALQKTWRESPELLEPIEKFYRVDVQSRIFSH